MTKQFSSMKPRKGKLRDKVGGRPDTRRKHSNTSANLDDLLKWGILTPEQTSQLVVEGFPHAMEGEELVQLLKENRYITDFQAGFLSQGRGNELVLEGYVLIDQLGMGGMGQVFRAVHRILKKPCALKILRAECSNAPNLVTRFRREMEFVGRLCHPNIVQALYAGEVDNQLFFVMELIDGEDLEHVLDQCGTLSVRDAADYVRQASAGLQHACEKGLVHRDIKPSNLMLTRSGIIKISDLGMAKLRKHQQDGADSLTPSGLVLGTPNYIAPEQIENSRAVDVRADIYSLGCSFYEMLTGQVPFTSPRLEEILFQQLSREPKPIAKFRDDVPEEIILILQRMMTKRPEDRYQQPQEVVNDLSKWLQSSSITPEAGHAQSSEGASEVMASPSATADTPSPDSEDELHLLPIEEASGGNVSTAEKDDQGETLELSMSQSALNKAFGRFNEKNPAPAEPVVADLHFDQFQVESVLHNGSRATIYRAHDLDTGTAVALKVLHPTEAEADSVGLLRFQREASLLAEAHDPRIVRFVASGQAESRHYFAMEFVDGPNLKVWQKQTQKSIPRFGVEDAMQITLHCAHALAHLHNKRILHRNVKPRNILIARGGALKLADFGLAKAEGQEELETSRKNHRLGTPAYIAPELFYQPDHFDVRSDLYALGCTCYFLLTRAVPFAGVRGRTTPQEILRNKNSFQLSLPSLLFSEIPDWVDAILARLLAPSPNERFQTAWELIEELEDRTFPSKPLSFLGDA